jgi:C-terminal processing protease CtpA/Prc
VDEYSASASEVLALALKQNIDAKLIGDTTFGK